MVKLIQISYGIEWDNQDGIIMKSGSSVSKYCIALYFYKRRIFMLFSYVKY